MGILTETRPMHVDGVAVINGQAGEDWLYEIALSDDRTGDKLLVIDWGRDLKVPLAGSNVAVTAASGTWHAAEEARHNGCLPELSGLGRISGPKRETGYVGVFSYHDGESIPYRRDTRHISTTLGRWFDRITNFLDPEYRRRDH